MEPAMLFELEQHHGKEAVGLGANWLSLWRYQRNKAMLYKILKFKRQNGIITGPDTFSHHTNKITLEFHHKYVHEDTYNKWAS